MVINHLEKLLVTNDAATILRELEVRLDNLIFCFAKTDAFFESMILRLLSPRNCLIANLKIVSISGTTAVQLMSKLNT